MKLKITRTTLVMLCLGSFTLLNAQSSSNSMTTDQRAELRQSSKASITQTEAQDNVDTKDEYLGKKEQILSRLKVKEIPASFPKYDGNISLEDYKVKTKEWYNNNKDLLREDFKQKLENL